jgi:hypothetical protein
MPIFDQGTTNSRAIIFDKNGLIGCAESDGNRLGKFRYRVRHIRRSDAGKISKKFSRNGRLIVFAEYGRIKTNEIDRRLAACRQCRDSLGEQRITPIGEML